MSRRAYPTDVTDAQWALLAPLVPAPTPGGRPPRHDRREVVYAMLSVLRSGEAWRLLPHDLPPWQTVSHSFRHWRLDGTWERMHTALREQAPLGRGVRPSRAGPSSTANRPRRPKKGAPRI